MDGIGIKSLANLGARGKWPGNCSRDLERLISRKGINLEPYFVKVPFRENGSLGVRILPVAVLLPHEVFAFLWEAGLGERHFFGDDGRMSAVTFWQKSQGEEWLEQHPAQP